MCHLFTVFHTSNGICHTLSMASTADEPVNAPSQITASNTTTVKSFLYASPSTNQTTCRNASSNLRSCKNSPPLA